MKLEYKAVFFDIDNTLFDTKRLAEASRKNAIRAMIESGFKAGESEAYDELLEIVSNFGSNYGSHFDELLKKFDQIATPHIIAAGIVAYHNTKNAYLVPYPEVVPTLITLRDNGLKLGVITDGLAVKQWEKLIKLGLQHFFHSVLISEEKGVVKPETTSFLDACNSLECQPDQAVMVGDKLEKDILGANIAGMTSVQVIRHEGEQVTVPKTEREEPDFVIHRLGALIDVLELG